MIPRPPLHGIHQWLPSAARAMHTNGLTAEQAVETLRAYETKLRRPYQPDEVERAVHLIYESKSRFKHDGKPMPSKGRGRQLLPKPVYKPCVLKRIAANLPEANQVWFKAQSPVSVDGMRPDHYLHHITKESEQIVCFTEFKSQGQHLWKHCPGPISPDMVFDDRFLGLKDGAWFLPQPVTGTFIEVERRKGALSRKDFTRRSQGNITNFRFALLESDEAPTDQWLSALAQLPLPIASVVNSGGKSLHALVLINAESKSQWDELVRGKLLPCLTVIGADPAALTAVRLTRLPNVHRGERLQELLYLNPEPSCTPIANLAPRAPHAPTIDNH